MLVRTWTLLAALAACDDDRSPVADRSCEITQLVRTPEEDAVDVLLVIDESPAMAGTATRDALARNLRDLGATLENIEGGLPSLHVGVVSADRARAGVLLADPGCGLRDAPFLYDLVRLDGTRERNYDGALGDTLACLGALGAGGGPIASPLAMMRAALDDSNPANAGFHRAGASMIVLFVAAQDDCSGPTELATPFACTSQGVRCGGAVPATPGAYDDCAAASGPDVEEIDIYVDFVRGLDPHHPDLLLASVVGGPVDPFIVVDGPELAPSCTRADGDGGARPAVRLRAFAERLSAYGNDVSFCDADWTPVLGNVGGLPDPPIDHCLDAVSDRDVDPVAAGLQIECNVEDVRHLGSPLEEADVLPRCAMLDATTPDPADARPCWWVEPHVPDCNVPWRSPHAHRVERAGYPPRGTYERWRCVALGCKAE